MFKLTSRINTTSYRYQNNDQQNNSYMLLCDEFKLPLVVTSQIHSDKPLNQMKDNRLKITSQYLKYDLGKEQNFKMNQIRKNFHTEESLEQDDLRKHFKGLFHISQTIEIPIKRKPEQCENAEKNENKNSIQMQNNFKRNDPGLGSYMNKDYMFNSQGYQHSRQQPPFRKQFEQQIEFKENKTSIQNSMLRTQQPNFPQRKLKSSLKCVFFIVIVKNLYKISRKKNIINLKLQLNRCKKVIQSYNQKYLAYQKKILVQNIANKILHYINQKEYVSQCETLAQTYGSDFRKTNIINITKLFYQNLELITRENNFLITLKSEMIIHLFYNTQRTTTHFIGQRCNFYNNLITHLPNDQKLAVGIECFFFKFLLPNILNLIGDLESESMKYKEEVFNNLISIPSLFHKQFVQKFQKLHQLQQPNGNMVFKIFNLQQLNKDEFKFNIDEANIKGNPEILIEGLIDFAALENLEKERPYWKIKMQLLFERICENFARIMAL